MTYRVICRRCSWEPEECVQCGPNVGFSPAQAGLVESYVSIMDLLAHANYTFEVEAVNGVSELSRTQRLFAAVSIATGQAGKTSNIQLISSGSCLFIYSSTVLQFNATLYFYSTTFKRYIISFYTTTII